MNHLPIRSSYEAPLPISLTGSEVALVPLAASHGDDLYALSTAEGAED